MYPGLAKAKKVTDIDGRMGDVNAKMAVLAVKQIAMATRLLHVSCINPGGKVINY